MKKPYVPSMDEDVNNGTQVEEVAPRSVTAGLTRIFRANSARINISISYLEPLADATPGLCRIGVSRLGSNQTLAVINFQCPNYLLTREEFGDLLSEDIYISGTDTTASIAASSLFRTGEARE